MRISRVYPNISYYPPSSHCAFNLHGMANLGNLDEVLTAAATSGRTTDELKVLSEQLFAEQGKKLPSARQLQDTFDWKAWRYACNFTGHREKPVYTENSGMRSITHPSIPFAPSIGFEMQFDILDYSIHNLGTPNLAIAMYPHALHALRATFEAYGVAADFLPRISFSEDGLRIAVPFEKPVLEPGVPNRIREDIATYTKQTNVKVDVKFEAEEFFGGISIKGHDLLPVYLSDDSARGEFQAFVPMAKKNKQIPCMVATSLLILGAHQAKTLYVIADNAKEK